VFLTIWDGNGIDTYDMANYTAKVTIDLQPGGFSITSQAQLALLNTDDGIKARGNVFNALQFNGDVRSLIENALGGSGDDTITGNVAANDLRGNGGADTLSGLDGADRLFGGDGNDTLNGGTGTDTLDGGAGNDTYFVDNAGDTVVEASGAGTDLVNSSIGYALGNNVENLILTGAGNINGYGNSLANTLTGNAGNNFIDGGLGNDTLTGGGGQDTFMFDTALTANVDTVADFNASNDTIRLDQSIFTAITTLGTLSAAAFFAGAAAHDADDRIIYNSATGNLFYDSDGTGATAAVQFAHLNGAPSVSNTSFNVVA
jgi:serralysin